MRIHKLAVSILAVLIAMLILPTKSYAQETKPTDKPKSTEQESDIEATEKRNIIEFSELSMKRLMQYEAQAKKSFDVDVFPSGLVSETGLCVTTFGSFLVDKNDLSIDYAFLDITEEKNSKMENEKEMAMCLASISALEYTEVDEDLIQLSRSTNKSGPSSALGAVIDMWVDDIQPIIVDTVKSSKSSDISLVKVYSGNYDYYFNTRNTEKGIEYYLVAEAREK